MGKQSSAEGIRKRAYKREYRMRNFEYWKRKSEESKNIRASLKDYGIDKTRLEELKAIVRSGRYGHVVFQAAQVADEMAARHILLSINKNLSYEFVQYDEKLGTCPLGRSNFYGARRQFFHLLDDALKELEPAESEGGTCGKI